MILKYLKVDYFINGNSKVSYLRKDARDAFERLSADSIKNNTPQLTISATNKYLHDVQYFENVFGGYIYYDKSQNGYFKWTIQSEKDIITFFTDYNKNFPLKSIKQSRFCLIPNYYYLKKIKAYQQPINTMQYKLWLKFNYQWKNYDNII